MGYSQWATTSPIHVRKKIDVLFRDVEGRQNFACDQKTSSFH